MDSRALERAWCAFADREGGSFVEGEHATDRLVRSPHVDVECTRDALVRFDLVTDERGTVWTRCRAHYVIGAGPRFQIYRERFRDRIAKLFGRRQDVSIEEHAGFDRAFIVETEAPEQTRAAVPAARQGELLERHPDSLLESDGRVVSLSWPEVEMDANALDGIAELVGKIAKHGLALLAPARGLDGARPVAASGPFGARRPPALHIDTGRTPIRLEVQPGDEAPALVALADAASSSPDFAVVIDGHGFVHGDGPVELEHPSWEPVLEQLGASDFGLSAGCAYVRWRSPPSSEAIAAAVDLLDRLLSPTLERGPFR